MATTLTKYKVPNSLGTLRHKYIGAMSRISRLSEKAGEKIEGVVKTLEIQAAAFTFGAIQGFWYDPTAPGDKPGAHFFGVPVEAAAGLGFSVLGLFGFGGAKWAHHLLNFGNGALAAYTSNLGRGWGYKFRKERAAKGGKTSGEGLRDEIASLLED